MKQEFHEILKNIYKFVTNRLFILFFLVGLMFYALVARLFEVQIVKGFDYEIAVVKNTKTNTVFIAAPRGEIYDCYGRPLATNTVAFTVKIDPSVKSKISATQALNFIKLMEANGEKIIENSQDFPISKERPHTFMLNDNAAREEKWKTDMGIPLEADAEEAFDYLREFFDVEESVSDEDAWSILSLASSVFMQRYYLNHITVAVNVKEITVAALEEKNQEFPGFYIDVDYLREYPAGENFSHMLGYIRAISSEEYEQMKGLGYKLSSIVGKLGLEKAFDLQLKGKDGEVTVETDASGRRVSTTKISDAVQGNNIVLTIDARLQNEATIILKDMLKNILINKLRGVSAKEKPVTSQELLSSMIKANNISIDDIMSSEEGSWSYKIRQYVDENFAEDKDGKNYKTLQKQFIADSIIDNQIPAGYVLLAMYEQGIIDLDEELIESLGKNNSKVLQTLISKVESEQITPQMANITPMEGSVFATNVKTGGVIVAASYPTYDNNELVNNFNNDYYRKLNNDPTSPMWYRAVSDPRAPGSTFKMITAIAGLETGTITTSTKVVDRGTFTEAGSPYASCWIHTPGYHGSVNVSGALEVSCNYFFYDMMYKMGNTKSDTKYEGISKLNKYMEYFGLNERSGVEISELYDSMPEDLLKISSPEFKAYKERSRNSSLTDAQVRWNDGESIRTAIGQSFNNYTAANMSKYIATLANGGNRYQLHFLDRIESASGEVLSRFEPNLEFKVPVKQEYLDAVYSGMYAVAHGDRGTAKTVFADFPIKIGAKTGTAQEAGFDHASFAAYAPFDNPQIAIYVVIPYGDTLTVTAPAAQVARDVMAEYFGINESPQTSIMNNSLAK